MIMGERERERVAFVAFLATKALHCLSHRCCRVPVWTAKGKLFTEHKEKDNTCRPQRQHDMTFLRLRCQKVDSTPVFIAFCHGNLRGPPQGHPPRNKALIRPYEGKPMVNSPLIRPYFLGGGWHWGGPLGFP